MIFDGQFYLQPLHAEALDKQFAGDTFENHVFLTKININRIFLRSLLDTSRRRMVGNELRPSEL